LSFIPKPPPTSGAITRTFCSGEDILHLKRRLVAVRDRQRPLARIEVGDQPARFKRDRGLPLELELLLDHKIGFGEGLRGIALLDREIERDVVAELVVDRDARAERLLQIADRRQRLPIDRDELGRIFSLGAGRGDDRDHRLALPDRFLLREQRLRRRAMAGPVQGDADERLAERIEVGGREHRGDAGRSLCGGDVDRPDPGVRVRAAHEAEVQHARQRNIVDVAAAAAGEPLELTSRNACTDAGMLRGGMRRFGHQQFFPSLPSCAATASTIAW
jgi:hypothetical protein